MNNQERLTLIEGSFSSEEAKDILRNIFSSKINFHRIKNWSSQERFGKDDLTAQIRIPLLEKEMEKLLAIIADAKTKNKDLIIKSDVYISLSEDSSNV